MKELEVITIKDKDYAIIREVKEENTIYVYLVNVEDENDIMIRKSSKQDENLYIPLENEEEYNLASMLLFKTTYEKSE